MTCLRPPLFVPLLLAVVLQSGCWSAFIYHPTNLSATELGELGNHPGWHIESILVDDDVELVGLVKPPRTSEAPWLLYFGGNAMSLAQNQEVLEVASVGQDFGLATFAYRGYDGSGGSPDEEDLVADAVKAADTLLTKYAIRPGRLILVGQSLGTGIATIAATELERQDHPPAGLVLLSPYRSMADVVNEHVPLIPVAWSVEDAFPALDAAKDSYVPILIIHGVSDSVISVKHARAFKKALGERVTLVEVNRGHNDLWAEPSPVIEPLQAFVKAHTSGQ